MILFATCQWGAGEYLLPLIRRWSASRAAAWTVVAEGPSLDYWRQNGVPVLPYTPKALEAWWAVNTPSAVVASASVGSSLERHALSLAAANEAPSAQFLDMWVGYAARFQVPVGEMQLPDTILAIDDRCKEEMVEEGLPAERIKVVGQPAFESIVAQAKSGTKSGRGVLVAGQPVAKFYGTSLGYTEKTFYAACLQGLSGAGYKGPVMLRNHPEEEDLPDTLPDRLQVSTGSGQGQADIWGCDTVLGMFSSQMITGFLAGHRVASVQPGLSGSSLDICPLSRWGEIPLLRSASEVAQFVAMDERPRNTRLREALAGSLDRLESFCLGLSRV